MSCVTANRYLTCIRNCCRWSSNCISTCCKYRPRLNVKRELRNLTLKSGVIYPLNGILSCIRAFECEGWIVSCNYNRLIRTNVWRRNCSVCACSRLLSKVCLCCVGRIKRYVCACRCIEYVILDKCISVCCCVIRSWCNACSSCRNLKLLSANLNLRGCVLCG